MAAAALVSAVDAVVGEDLSVLTVAELQERYVELAPQVQRLTGFGATVLAELQCRTGGLLPTDDGKPRPLPGWVAEASGDSASAAGRMLRVAGALQAGLPRVAASVLDGTVPFVRAEVLTRLVGRIPAQALAEAEPGLIEVARRMDPTQLAAWVRHQLATWVEPVLDEQERDASAARYLKTRSQSDGSVWGSFLLPAGDAETVLSCLEPLARRQGDQDQRSAAQRRADALTEVCEQVLRHGELPDAGGFRPQLSYVLPADWAARRAGKHDCADCRRCPAHQPPTYADLVAAAVPRPRDASRAVPAEHACAVAAWTGPQTRARIETVLCDARITRVLLNGVGQVTGMEQVTEHVTKAQRRALAARDLGCAAMGCTRPPAMCDAHHLTARADGGAHALHNLVLLCRRHHVLWHLGKIDLHDLHVPWLADLASTGPPGRPPP
ncbi:MAG: putative endonuclease [Frankiales bacterium]|jgi:hypothetical protein|nr:putative endonuclease [Frankiales bacterium]